MHRLKRPLGTVFICLTLIIIGSQGLSIFLPTYLESKIVPKLARYYHLPLTVHIRRLGLFKADFNDIHLGDQSTSGLQIDALRLDYSPRTLWHKKIDRITLAGLELNLRIENGQVIWPKFLKETTQPPTQLTTQVNPIRHLPQSFNEIIMSKAVINIMHQGHLTRIPWQLNITSQPGSKIAGHLTLNIAGHHLNNTALLDLKDRKLQFSSDILAPGTTLAIRSAALNLTIQEHKHYFEINGTTTINLANPPKAALTITPLTINMPFNGKYQNDNRWQIAIQKEPGAIPLTIKNHAWEVTSHINNLAGKGKGQGGIFSFQYNIGLSAVALKATDGLVLLDKLQMQGQTNNSGTKLLTSWQGTAQSNDLKAKLKGEIPLQWPPLSHAARDSGRINIDNIHWQDMNLGKAAFAVSQSTNGFTITGNYLSALLPDLCLALDGHLDLSHPAPLADLTFHNACKSTFKGLDLGRLTPNLAGYSMDADLEISGGGQYKSHLLQGHIKGTLHKINLQKGNDFNMQGGELSLAFPGLRLKSEPGLFTFQQANFGDISLKDGRLEFQIESPDSILLEKSSAKWCNGHIYTQAMRFSPKIQDYDLSLYCDHLNVAQLLEQFGAASAEGQGQVNGRIPIKISGSCLIPQQGFLYSTPGEGGTIRLSNMQRLTDGVPPGTPQFAQIDLAREALKDFSYDWTRIDLNSAGDDLLMHLQIDGKPASPLPFVYKKEFGGFVRVDATSPGSHFQGIKLNVNFRLPLNQILYYGHSIKQLTN